MKKHHNLLCVDDEAGILRILALTFEDEYTVFTATSGAEALDILEQEDISLIIADQRMPGMSGVELLERSIAINPHIIRIILTGYTDTSALVQAINSGQIYRYISKPWNREELKMTVKRALDSYMLTLENERLLCELKEANNRLRFENRNLKQVADRDLPFVEIIAQSRMMQEVMALAQRVLDNDATILLTGETGTGKSAVANYIHHHGARHNRPLLVQNCGTLPEYLQESELFGHAKGAFTGASTDKKGVFEAANGGTIFLDEVSEMHLSTQVKLLQVIQEKRFRPVGDTQYRDVDVRIIAASNRELYKEVQRGNFREDLYHRLNVFPIHIPPLRERPDDIQPLAEHCLKKFAQKLNKPVAYFTEPAMVRLKHYTYPGNVRELENILQRALILCDKDKIGVDELSQLLGASAPKPCSTLEQIEREHILDALQSRRGNIGLAARDLGISRTTLWRRMHEYHIDVPEVMQRNSETDK